MKLSRPFAVVLLIAAIALVALPVASFAQSAGDNQYQDPLGGGTTTTPSTPSSQPSTPSSGSSSQGGGNTQSPSSSAAQSSPSSSGTKSHASANVPLAHTGFEAWVPGLAGVLLLAGGAALLLAPRRQPRRR